MVSGGISLEEFRANAIQFLNRSSEAGVACPGFGSIMPPRLHDRAKAWHQHMFANGFAQVSWPTEFGGQGLGPEFRRAWIEECARREIAPYFNFQGSALTGGALLRFGTDEQKRRYLPAIAAGTKLWCQLFSEPESGSDLASLRTQATQTTDGWTITGQKIWSSNAQMADYGILLARTSPTESKHRGISFFLFDMSGRGVDVRPLKQMTGDHEFCEVFFDGAHVAQADLLGPLHGGWSVAVSVLADERAEVGAAGIGLEKRTQRLVDKVNARTSPTERARVLQARTSASATRHLLDRSAGDPTLGPLAKLSVTEFAAMRTNTELDLMGAAAVAGGNPETIESFLYAPGMRVAGGTSEIQKNLIAERLLGLPREPPPAKT